MEKQLSYPLNNFSSWSSYHSSRILQSSRTIKRNYWRLSILMICRTWTPSTSMKFSIKVACKFHTNLKRLIEQINVCISSIIIKIQMTTRIWVRFIRRRERLITFLRITSKTSVPNHRFLERAMLSTRTTISLKVAWPIVKGRIWLAMI